jgi:hypothetical protein
MKGASRWLEAIALPATVAIKQAMTMLLRLNFMRCSGVLDEFVPTGTLDTRYAARWIQFFVEQAKKNILAAQTATEPLASYFDQLTQI